MFDWGSELSEKVVIFPCQLSLIFFFFLMTIVGALLSCMQSIVLYHNHVIVFYNFAMCFGICFCTSFF
jgi:hypothetical protein